MCLANWNRKISIPRPETYIFLFKFKFFPLSLSALKCYWVYYISQRQIMSHSNLNKIACKLWNQIKTWRVRNDIFFSFCCSTYSSLCTYWDFFLFFIFPFLSVEKWNLALFLFCWCKSSNKVDMIRLGGVLSLMELNLVFKIFFFSFLGRICFWIFLKIFQPFISCLTSKEIDLADGCRS